MEENIQLIFDISGGEDAWGNVEDFKGVLNDEETRRALYEDVGGEEDWGDFQDFSDLIYTPPTQEDLKQAQSEERAYLGLEVMDEVDSITNEFLKENNLGGESDEEEVGNSGDLSSWDQMKVLGDIDFWRDNMELGYISGRMGNMNEILEDNLLGRGEEEVDPEYFAKMTTLRNQQREVSARMEKNRGANRNAGRFFTDVVGGIVSSPVGMVTELFSDVDGVGQAVAAALLTPYTRGKSLQAVMGLAGADVEAGSIINQKIDEYGAENGIDVYTEEGLRKVYEDKEFITKIKKKAAIGGAIVGAAEAIGGGVASRVGRAAKKIEKARHVGYNFAGRLAVGAAFDGVGEATKQLAVDGKVDPYEVGIEAFSGPTQSAVMVMLETKADRKALGDNQILTEAQQALDSKEYRDNVKSGAVRERGDQGTASTVSDLTNLTPAEAAVVENAPETEGVIPETDETGRSTEETVEDLKETPTLEDGTTLDEDGTETLSEEDVVDALTTAATMKKEALNPVRDTVTDTVADGEAENLSRIADTMVKRGLMREEMKDNFVNFTGTLQQFMTTIPKEIRDGKDINSRAKSRELLQTFLDIDTAEADIKSMQDQIKVADERIPSKLAGKLAKRQKQLAAMENSLATIAKDNEMSLSDYDDTTSILRIAQNKNKYNYRLPRIALNVKDGKVTINEGVEGSVDIIDAVQEYNDTFPDRKPLELVTKQNFTEAAPAFTYDAESVEINYGSVVVDNTAKGKVAPLTFKDASSEGLENTVRGLRGEGIRAIVKDPSILSEEQKQVWDGLVANDEATLTKNGYRALSEPEVKRRKGAKIKKAGEDFKARREVNVVLEQKNTEAAKKKQASKAIKAAHLQGKKPKVVFRSDNDFRAAAPQGRENDMAYVTDLDSDTPTIVVNTSSSKSTTIPHEMAHILIAAKLGTRESRKDFVVEMVTNLREVMKSSSLPSERALLQQLDKMLVAYEERGDSADILAEEFLAELSAYLTINESRLTKSPSVTRKIVRAIKQAIKNILGQDVKVNIDTINQSIDFVNNLADELSGDTTQLKEIKKARDKKIKQASLEKARQARKDATAARRAEKQKQREAIQLQRRKDREAKMKAAKEAKTAAQKKILSREHAKDVSTHERIDELLATNEQVETIDSEDFTDVGVYNIEGMPKGELKPKDIPKTYQIKFRGGKKGPVYVVADKDYVAEYNRLKKDSGPVWAETSHPLKTLVEGETGEGGIILDIRGQDFTVQEDGQTRSAYGEGLDDGAEDFIRQVMETDIFNDFEKRAMLKEYGITDVEIDNYGRVTQFPRKPSSARYTQPTQSNPNPPTDIEAFRQTIPNSDSQLDANLTEDERLANNFHYFGSKIDNASIERFLRMMGLEDLPPSKRITKVEQLIMAARLGYLDPPGTKVGTAASSILIELGKAAPSVNEYMQVALAAAHGQIKEAIREVNNQIRDNEGKINSDNTELFLRKGELDRQLLTYGTALKQIGSIFGRGLGARASVIDLKLNTKEDVRQFVQQNREHITPKLRKKLEAEVENVEAAEAALERVREDELGKINKERKKTTIASLKEILGLNEPKTQGYLDEITSLFSSSKAKKTKNSGQTRSAIGRVSPKVRQVKTQKDKYTDIFKAVKYLIANEGLNTLDALSDRVIEINDTLDAANRDYDINKQDVENALILGKNSTVARRKKALQNKIAKMKVFLADSTKLVNLHEAVSVAGANANPADFKKFSDQLQSYITTLLKNSFDTDLPITPATLDDAISVLQNAINDYDTVLFSDNGNVIQKDLIALNKKFNMALRVLGVNNVNGNVDIDGLLKGATIALEGEDAGVFSGSSIPSVTLSEKSPAVLRAENEMIMALSALRAQKSKVARARRKAEAEAWQDKLKVAFEGVKPYLFEMPRQVVYSVDYSFILMQAGANVIGMLPQAVVDTAVIKAKGIKVAPQDMPFVSMKNMWNRQLAHMFANRFIGGEGNNFLNKSAAKEAYLQLVSDPLADEMMSIRNDVFGNPTREAQAFEREEFARANIGGRLSDWLDANPATSAKVLGKAAKVVGIGADYFSDTYTMFMNDIRLHQYRMFKNLNPHATIEQKKKVIEGIMNFTGRGVATNKIESFFIGSGAANVLSAPRLYLSRYKIITGLFDNLRSLAVTGGANRLNVKQISTLEKGGDIKLDGIDFASLELFKQYVSAGMGIFIAKLALESILGWELEDDPKDKSFLKMKREDKVLDISAGLAAFIKIPAFALYEGVASSSQKRADEIFGETKASQKASLKNRTIAGDVGKMLRYKLHPTIGLGLSAITGENAIGQGMGITGEQRMANVVKTVIPISAQAVMDVADLGRVRLDPDDDWDFTKLVTILGVGEIDYENSLKDIRVVKYADQLEYVDSKKNKKKGYALNSVISATHAKKFIVGNSNELGFEDIVESNMKEDLLDAFKAAAQNELGEWILKEMKASRNPSKDAILDKGKEIAKVWGKRYYDAYIRPDRDRWEWIK